LKLEQIGNEVEAKDRELEIEASLENVRSKAMAMQKSDDLAAAVAIVFDQLDKLNLGMLRCGIGIINKEKRSVNVWTTTKSGHETIAQVSGSEFMDIHPLLQGAFDAWVRQDEDFSYILGGEDLTQFYSALTKTNFKLPDSQSIESAREDFKQYYYNVPFPAGSLYAFRESPFPDEAKKVMKRFANVFNLTYTRFNDLKKAEAQAREAQIEVALERIRAKALAMQSSDDLLGVAVELREQMGILGQPDLESAIVHLYNGNSEVFDSWYVYCPPNHASNEMVMGTASVEKNSTAWAREVIANYQSQATEYTIVSSGEKIMEWYKMIEKIAPATLEYNSKGEIVIPETLHYHFCKFSGGALLMISNQEPSLEARELQKRAAAVFDLAYTRFLDLKQSEFLARKAEQDLINLKEEKKRTENALAELKAAQSQLIQAEKMASLGELTAGIAHEIQNPLNFVNNFSEVNNELIGEMKQKLTAGNIDEAIAISNDIEQNLEKINYHGKRADGIVKGMLQHSRSSAAVKEPTDINKLAEEYMRLSYHGLRAKDNFFNATMETNFDETIGNINVIPQDIGRVILNLSTNAFYAVMQKKKQNIEGYEPKIILSTRSIKLQGGDLGVEISVSDNGNGIPEKVLDKIFQPFFTTKPTGQGTGLGLSLSYDIVKAHGGELKVDTKEGEGSTFIIYLPV
jgi:signal transduction histidine kinase